MKKFTEIFPKVILGILLLCCTALTVVVVFHLGGSGEALSVAGNELDNPNYTDPLLYLCYTLLGLGILASLYAVGVSFAGNIQTNPKAAIKTVCVLVGFVAIGFICWYLGSPEKVEIVGYDGHDNEGVMARFTDAVLYGTYFLVAATLLTIVGGMIATIVKKKQ